MLKLVTGTLPPIFIRANLSFSLMKNKYELLHQNISEYGLLGVRWPHFDPFELVSEEIRVQITTVGQKPNSFDVKATIVAERTISANYLGMQFEFNEIDRIRLREAISNEGFYPTHQLRKYPRIPAVAELSTMPLHAIVHGPTGELTNFDVVNLSLSGILLHTENLRGGFFNPGARLKAQVDPRGAVSFPFMFEGIVCRVSAMQNIKTKNIGRSLGIKFIKIADSDKQNFFEILRSVLDKFKKAS